MLDLLVEDMAKIEVFADVTKEAHFVISFVKRHAILYEEFLEAKETLSIRHDLKLYPKTRFAYMYLMLQTLFKTIGAIRLVLDSGVYRMMKQEAISSSRRGNRNNDEDDAPVYEEDDQADTAEEKFNRFEAAVESGAFKRKLSTTSEVLQPFSHALHYLEGDSVPLSHVYPVFQALYSYVEGLQDKNITDGNFITTESRQQMLELITERWAGTSRKVGLKHKIHLLAFVLDPYAQAAVSTPKAPLTPLINSSVTDQCREALRQLILEPGPRSVVAAQLQLWLAARPNIVTNPSTAASTSADNDDEEDSVAISRVQQQGENTFSSLYLASMRLVWDKVLDREKLIRKGEQKRVVTNSDDIGYDLAETIARLQLASFPSSLWLSMKAELPMGATPQGLANHQFFCTTALNISCVVGHTCGVERAGKAYKQIMTAQRKSIKPGRMMKSIFSVCNYDLLRKGPDMDDSSPDVADLVGGESSSSVFVDEDVDEELHAVQLHALRRGRIITDSELTARGEGSDSEEGSGPEEGEGGSSADEDEAEASGEAPQGGRSRTRRVEQPWNIADDLQVAEKPTSLTAELEGKLIYIRWKSHGWCLGKVKQKFTIETPRLFAKFNYRVQYSDGWENHLLMLDNYEGGSGAPYKSWVLLEKKA